MTSILFDEFFDMVDETFGAETADAVIAASGVPGAGQQDARYGAAEMAVHIDCLSELSGVPVSDLMRAFGRRMIGRFRAAYPTCFSQCGDVLSFVECVARRADSDLAGFFQYAAPPKLSTARLADGGVEFSYCSRRRMADLVEAMQVGAIELYGTGARLERRDMPDDAGAQCVSFTLKPM